MHRGFIGDFPVTRRAMLVSALGSAAALAVPAVLRSQERALPRGVDPQPYFAEVNRALETLARLGAPVHAGDTDRIRALAKRGDAQAVEGSERILGSYTLIRAALEVNGPTGIVGGAPRVLVEKGWRMFLVRVENPTARAETFAISGMFVPGRILPSDLPSLSQRAFLYDRVDMAPWIETMWADFVLAGEEALTPLPIQYRVVQVYSRDRGRRSISPILASRNRTRRSVTLDFECIPSRDVRLRVRDVDGRGCMASLTVRDVHGRVYPPQAMRIAPDLPFQQQIYRADGESVRLPDGEYLIESQRGPEYLRGAQTVKIGETGAEIDIALRRWIDPAEYGWYSGDTHIHAAGCAHYEIPTEGVSPETIIRHVRGEALSIGEVLTWGPSYYYQKRFFSGRAQSPAAQLEHAALQEANNSALHPVGTPVDSHSQIRYDVEISGFPSSHAGHLVLLGLTEQDYPGARVIEDWPSWNLPILKWAKAQGALAGYAHSGGGMILGASEIPSYEMPPFDSTGANEALVDVTHGCVDFLSGCERSPQSELNAWYHMLNCGYRLAMVGETDFPCISDEKVGLGRSYVRLDGRPTDDDGYRAWLSGLHQGRLYCGDGRSHFLQFAVHGRTSGDADLMVGDGTTLEIEGLIAARLDEEPIIDRAALPFWHLEHARVGSTRNVPLELVVNGFPAQRALLLADGRPRRIRFSMNVVRSSWIALRILPSGHTHPVFVSVNGNPIRASRRSAGWCRAAVGKLWQVKSAFIRPEERPAALEAYDHARRAYESVLAGCDVE